MTALDPVFNDLSSQPLATDMPTAYSRISTFITLIVQLPTYGLGPGLRIPQNFYILEIAKNYNIHNWTYDHYVPAEERTFLLTLATKSPYLDQVPSDVMVREPLIEVSIAKMKSDALNAAYLLDVPLISFRQPPWEKSYIDAECLDLSSDGETGPEKITLINLSKSEHLSFHSDWIRKRRKREITTMSDLWSQRTHLFPSLVFCPVVEGQVVNVGTNDPHFQQIINKLFELETYFTNWRHGGFDRNMLTKCNPVSEETCNHKRYKHYYHFRTANDMEVIANWHLYLTPGAWRLYFNIDEVSRRCVICHIGKKLPDVTYGRI